MYILVSYWTHKKCTYNFIDRLIWRLIKPITSHFVLPFLFWTVANNFFLFVLFWGKLVQIHLHTFYKRDQVNDVSCIDITGWFRNYNILTTKNYYTSREQMPFAKLDFFLIFHVKISIITVIYYMDCQTLQITTSPFNFLFI